MPGSRRAALQRARTVLVAGVAGGTGTTTIAALLADAVGGRLGVVVQSTDHSGGELAARLPSLRPATSRVTVHDTGAHVGPAAVLAATPENCLVVVGRATPDGTTDVRTVLTSIAREPDPTLLARSVVVLVDRSARPTAVDTRPVRDTGVADVLVLRADPALSRPGRIDLAVLGRPTIATVSELLTALGW
jgi:MinD-like ATPase involved in chromosome partitioning or flagellar assembly